MNKWNIPNWMEKEIILRDTVCVYCGVKFQKDKNNRKQVLVAFNNVRGKKEYRVYNKG